MLCHRAKAVRLALIAVFLVGCYPQIHGDQVWELINKKVVTKVQISFSIFLACLHMIFYTVAPPYRKGKSSLLPIRLIPFPFPFSLFFPFSLVYPIPFPPLPFPSITVLVCSGRCPAYLQFFVFFLPFFWKFLLFACSLSATTLIFAPLMIQLLT